MTREEKIIGLYKFKKAIADNADILNVYAAPGKCKSLTKIEGGGWGEGGLLNFNCENVGCATVECYLLRIEHDLLRLEGKVKRD
jgi:hypothetical protein